MTGWSWVLLLLAGPLCNAQTSCSPTAFSEAAGRARNVQRALRQIHVDDLDTEVPPEASDRLTQLKDALNCLADGAIAPLGPRVDPIEIQNMLAAVLKANPAEPAEKSNSSNNDHRIDDPSGPYGGNLTVRVGQPPSAAPLLEVEFSTNIPCGDDHMLLIYGLHDGRWKKQMRWQAPPLKAVSDAFGDFFLSGMLSAPDDSMPRVVIAHGTPWCTSRFSGFAMDVLSPSGDPNLPAVLWHTRRSYDRSDFTPTLKTSSDTFELRVNESSFDLDVFERRVIYRYRLDKHQGVRRIEPIAIHARGFVEEWLSAPWPEAEAFSEPGAGPALRVIHDQFERPARSNSEFVMYTHGPVRGCNVPGMIQVEIRSTLEKMVPGKPGGESQTRPTDYFHVAEIRDGYLMVSASTQPDPTCRGANRMPANVN